MRTLIASLRAMPHESVGYEDSFHELMREVLHHVADEETIILPLAEELLPDQLGELGVRMMKRRAQLLRPHVREIAVSSMRAFPLLCAAVAAGTAYLAWAAVRPRS